MSEQGKERKFLEYPMVIDWLQWSDEFEQRIDKPDMPQVALTLIAEMKKENENLRSALKLQREVSDAINDNVQQAFLLQKENEALKAKLEKAKEALEFYGAWETWSFSKNEYPETPLRKDSDGEGFIPGNLARQTLKEIEEMK